jgi:hypothetical protein
LQIAQAVRDQNPAASLLVRCRYHDNIEALQQAGCNAVICDETEATQAIERLLANLQLDTATPPTAESAAA